MTTKIEEELDDYIQKICDEIGDMLNDLQNRFVKKERNEAEIAALYEMMRMVGEQGISHYRENTKMPKEMALFLNCVRRGGEFRKVSVENDKDN